MTAEQLELNKKTPETLEEELTDLGQTIEGKLMDTVEPQGRLGEDSRMIDMTYSATLVEETMLGGHIWREASVTIPNDNEQPRRYSVSDGIPRRTPIVWSAGDTTARFTDTDITGRKTTHEVTGDRLEELSKDLANSRVFDPTKEKLAIEHVDRGGMVEVRQEIVPLNKPRKGLRRMLGRKAAGDKAIR